jgi:hypothetical protein
MAAVCTSLFGVVNIVFTIQFTNLQYLQISRVNGGNFKNIQFEQLCGISICQLSHAVIVFCY